MAFASNVISNAHLGTWDYYIMSDNVAVWRTLNGLATWFAANAGIIQAAALLGSIITLALVLFGAAAHSKVLNAGTLGIWFFFMAGMGMVGKAQVTNIYTNQVTVIDNVPALALIPASMFSKGGYNIFRSMETAYQSVNGSYMTVKANSFSGPLDILLALRSPRFPDHMPYINKTLVQVVHDCAENPTGGAALDSLANSKDAIFWLRTNGRQNGLTKVYSELDTTGQGTVTDCATALFGLDTTFNNLAAGNAAMVSFLNTETTKKNPQVATGDWNAGTIGTAWSFLYGAVPGMAQNAQEFTKNALTATTIQNTMDCMSQSGMLTTPETCMAGALASADGKERWKTEAAMAGSGFLKTMFTSMGFLQILFFALFPFIAVYGLLVVHKTGTIFGGYILIGIWSQSWMIVVAPIQSYIQTSIIDDMTKALSASHAVTLANMGTVYDQLSTKLGVASDMMANAQMLSLALLSGSVVALSSLAGKWNAGGHNDSSLLQNKPTDSAPLFKNNSSLSTIGSFRNDKGGTTSTMDDAGAAGMSIATTFMANQGNASSHDRSRMTSEQRANALVAGIKKETGYTLSKEDAASIIKSSDAATSFTGGISAGVAGDVLKAMMKSGAIRNLSGAELSHATQSMQRAQGAAVTQLAAKDSGFISKLSSADADVRGEAWGQVAETAVELVTAGAMALEVGTGVGVLATGATFAAGAAAKIGAKKLIKDSVSSKAKKSGAEAAKKESKVMDALKDLPGAVAAGVSGNVDAMAKAVMTDGIKKSNSYSASKKNTTGTGVSVSENDGLTTAVTGAETDRYTQSASVGQTSTTSITLDHASLTKMAVAGFNGKTSDQIRQQAATSAAMYRNGEIRKKKDGSAFTKGEIDYADQFVATAMMGHSSGDAGVDQFKRNVLFEQALTNQVNGSLGTGPGIPVGANFTNEGKPVAAAGTKAVAPTKGHWEKDKAGKPHDPKQDVFTLRQWGDGEDPTNKARQAAAHKAGMHWVPGTPGRAATEGTMRLQQDSEELANLNTHVDHSGVGKHMGNAQGSAAFQRTAQIVDTADRALEGLSRKAITAEQALGQFSPEALEAFDVKRTDTGHYIMAATGAKVTADMAGAIIEKIRGRDKEAAPAPTPAGTPPPEGDKKDTQAQKRTPLNPKSVANRTGRKK